MIETVAKASDGDSDSRMFLNTKATSIWTTVWVDSNASASTITFGQIESDMEYRQSIPTPTA